MNLLVSLPFLFDGRRDVETGVFDLELQGNNGPRSHFSLTRR